MLIEVVKREDGVYEIHIRTRSRVVSFKAKSDVIRRFDLLLRLHNLGSRSGFLSRVVEALTRALDEASNGSIKKISLNVEYVNGDETKKVTVSLIP